MRYFISLFIFTTLITGCEKSPATMTRNFGMNYWISEITIDGITHEYLHKGHGICHYPECKYCKKKEVKQ